MQRLLLPLVVISLSSTLLTSETQAAVLGYWRFENSSDLGEDSSGNNIDLTNTGVVGSYALPVSGIGSDFYNPIPSTGAANTNAGNFELSESDRLSVADPFGSGLGDFTIEALVNLESAGATTEVRPIASQWSTTSSNHSWSLGITGESSGLGARNLILQLTPTGGSGSVINIDSDFQLTLGSDYYVAASLNFEPVTGLTATFYFQDLTAGGLLQSAVRTNAITGVFNSTANFYIGRGGTTGGSILYFDGVIDEVRLSDSALGQNDLLAVPEPSATLLVSLGLAVTLFRRKSRRS